MDMSRNVTKRRQKPLSLTDALTKNGLFIVALISASFIVIIAFFIAFYGVLPFITDNNGLGQVSLIRFLTGTTWLEGPTFVSVAYGAGFLVINTLFIVILSLFVSFPISILCALFIAKIAPKNIAVIMRSIVELMASIPSIVYGLVGAGLLLPIIYFVATNLGFNSSGGNSTLGAVIVLALMSIPTMTAIAETSIRSVDPSLEQASLALGVSKMQTNFSVVLVAAKSGIFSGVILAVGRALGEATAVALVIGNARSGPTLGLFQISSTITSTMLQGMKETTGIDYDIRFSLGLLLMAVIVLTNLLLNFVKRRVGRMDA